MTHFSGHCVFIGKVWPEPNSSAAGTRIVQLIDALIFNGYQITFLSAAQESPYSQNLNPLGCDTAQIELNDSSFNDVIRRLNPDIVIFDRFTTEEQFGWRVEETCPDAIRILDTEDLHFLRKVRYDCWRKGKVVTERDILSSDLAKREIASMYRCDLSLIISSAEMELLEHLFHFPQSLLLYLPLWVGLTETIPKTNWETRQGFISIGNFLHKPNLEAVRFLKKELWPRIREKNKTVHLNIYGAYVPEEVQNMHHPSTGFIVHGRAQDAKDVISKSKCLLAPLFFGAGIKGKILDAIQTATPVVTTSIGAEGMFTQDDAPGCISDSVEEMADKALRLHEDEIYWKQASVKTTEIIKRHFSEEMWRDVLPQKIEKLRSTLGDDRAENFTGSMLRYHKNNSTRYMSKWIEAKNAHRE